MEPDQRDPLNQYSLQSLRESCDVYDDGRDCPSPGWVTMTEFTADQMKDLRNAADLALNIYNQKQKNFNLEKVCKLNFTVSYFFMTFTAKNAETDECRVFRGGVHSLSHKVYLCEVKASHLAPLSMDDLEHQLETSLKHSTDVDDDFEIPSDDVENYVETISEKGDHSSSTRIEKDIGDDSTVGLVDVSCDDESKLSMPLVLSIGTEFW